MSRIECFKPTSEDWYGNFKIADDARHANRRFVHVSLMLLNDGNWRCCVWGNDDMGMELDEPDELWARHIYNTVCQMVDVTKDALTQLGFVRA